ncbi:probable cytochrome P450 6a14 [Sabethes cyaneus]|uniref:probable cytochrome P450 6a14 n=1 Tax=Sabethes cyaneus TaxID=53552 RepID=UPI00237D6BF0|nr:probable cytochrome P450 6a14 [Sabethes cyaneus]
MISYLTLAAVAVTLTVLWIRKRYAYWKERGIAYVKPSFPFGNLSAVGRKEHLSSAMRKCYKQLKGHGPIGGIFFFINPVALIIDLDLIKSVLVKDFQYFHDRLIYHNEQDDPLTGHLLALEGTKWKNLRAKLTPTFTSGKMKMMFPTILAVGDEFHKTVAREVTKSKDLEMKDILARFTTDVIGTCAFGLECNSLQDPEAEFRRVGRRVINLSFNRQIKFFLAQQFRTIARQLHVKIIDPEVTHFFSDAVKNTIEYREKNNIDRTDFISLLIKLMKGESLETEGASSMGTLSLREATAQAFVFFLAGFETSSSAMSFCLYELALRPELQEKARKDVLEAIRKHGSITYEAIQDMKYVDYCLSESLRMYPPVSNLLRSVTKPYKVPGSNVTLEQGSTVIVPLYAIHHDPDYFPNPEQFDPDRFTPEQTAKRNPYCYMPFGEGPRNCIGMRFGLMQARIGLALLLNSFQFSLSSKTSVPIKLAASSGILASEGGLWLHVEEL